MRQISIRYSSKKFKVIREIFPKSKQNFAKNFLVDYFNLPWFARVNLVTRVHCQYLRASLLLVSIFLADYKSFFLWQISVISVIRYVVLNVNRLTRFSQPFIRRPSLVLRGCCCWGKLVWIKYENQLISAFPLSITPTCSTIFSCHPKPLSVIFRLLFTSLSV